MYFIEVNISKKRDKKGKRSNDSMPQPPEEACGIPEFINHSFSGVSSRKAGGDHDHNYYQNNWQNKFIFHNVGLNGF